MKASTWALIGLAVGGGVLLIARNAFKPAADMKISDAGIETIKRHEGWRASVYLDAAGLPTIGYGHLIKPGESFTTITLEQGEQILRQDVTIAENAVRRLVKVPITQSMYDALVSLVFNIGAGAFEKSTLLRTLNAGEYTTAAAEFIRWNKAGGRELKGLTLRRADEAAMFQSGLA